MSTASPRTVQRGTWQVPRKCRGDIRRSRSCWPPPRRRRPSAAATRDWPDPRIRQQAPETLRIAIAPVQQQVRMTRSKAVVRSAHRRVGLRDGTGLTDSCRERATAYGKRRPPQRVRPARPTGPRALSNPPSSRNLNNCAAKRLQPSEHGHDAGILEGGGKTEHRSFARMVADGGQLLRVDPSVSRTASRACVPLIRPSIRATRSTGASANSPVARLATTAAVPGGKSSRKSPPRSDRTFASPRSSPDATKGYPGAEPTLGDEIHDHERNGSDDRPGHERSPCRRVGPDEQREADWQGPV